MLRIKKKIIVVLLLPLGGCGGFSPQHGDVREELLGLETPEAAGLYARKISTDTKLNAILDLQEKARLHQLAGEYQESQKLLAILLDIYRAREYEATFTVEDVSKGAALFTNDKVIPYGGSDYERIFARQLQAMNYLVLGQVDKALIEIRAGANDQRFAAEAREKIVDQAEADAREKYINRVDKDQLALLTSLAGDTRNGFLSSYMYYFSALMREATQEHNSAFIDYRKAWQLQPTNRYIGANLVTLAGQYDRSNQAGYQQKTGVGVVDIPEGSGRVAVLIERGFVAPRAEFIFDVQGDYLRADGSFNIFSARTAVPTYEQEFNILPAIGVEALPEDLGTATVTGKSQYLFSTLPMAAYQLKEAMAGILARQIARLAVKQAANQLALNVATQSASSDDALVAVAGLAGFLATAVVTTISEQADTRSWVSLPQQVDNLEMVLPKGNHVLKVDLGGGREAELKVTVRSGGLTIARLIDTGTFAIGSQLYPKLEN